MSNYKRLRPVALALCAAVSWGSAQAATVSQSKSFTSPTFTLSGNGNDQVAGSGFYQASLNPFDGNLGTLTGFKITWVADTSVTITVASPNNAGVAVVGGGGAYLVNNLAYVGNGYSGPTTTASATPTSGPVSIDPSVTQVTDFLVSDVGLNYAPGILAALTGNSPVTLGWNAVTTVNYGSIATGSAIASGKFTLDYIYTAAGPTGVPEPGSLALAFGGLLAAGAVRRAPWQSARLRSLRS